MTEGETGYFYRYEEHEMLAQIVMRLFNRNDFEQLSAKEREVALARHDRQKNAGELAKIYCHILKLNHA